MATKISVPKRKNSGACKENAEKSYCFESTNVWTTNGLASKNKIRLSGCERIVFSLRLHHQRANGLHTKKGTGFFLGVLAKTQFVQNAKTQFENTKCNCNQPFGPKFPVEFVSFDHDIFGQS